MDKSSDITHMLKIISERMTRNADLDLSKIGLTLAQWRVIAFVETAAEAVSQKEIETYMGISHPAVVGILKRLEAKGILYSEIDSSDKRIKRIIMTDNGKELRKKVGYFRRQMEDRLLKGFDNSEIILLRQMLDRLKGNME